MRIVRAAQGWLDEHLLAWPENDDLLIDVGRFRAGEVQHSAPVRRCDALLLMTGTRAEELATTASVIGDVVKAMRPGATLYLLYVASGQYSASEATDSLNELVKRRLFRIAGTIPYDPKAAATLCDGGRNAGKIATRWFGSIASELAASTAHRTLGATVHAASAAAMNGVA